MTTKACRQKESMDLTSLNGIWQYKVEATSEAWMLEYCRLAVREENRIAKLTNSKTIDIPRFCTYK